MSPDGVCRTFDSRAKGTVFGSGVGIVVLKRLSDAIADGDTIHAVIKGGAVNNDGSLKVGFTAPGVVGQSQAIAEALASAGVHPESISYVEAHGTGTELGDPIEISALTRAYQASTDRTGYCAVGSVKPNVGHLDAAAGVSSLIKTVMSLKNRQIAPTINYEQPNPKIDFENSPFYVNTVLRPWPADGAPRRAGVSSFGFGGTNAHVIVEEAPEPKPSGPARSQQLLLLSAKTETALEAAAARLAEHLIEHRQANLADVAYTLTVGRRMFKHRRVVACGTVPEAIDALQGGDGRRVFTGEASGNERSVVFMFPGQGSQYVNMGLDLYREEPVFRSVVDDCAAQLEPHLGFDLRSVLFPPDGPSEAASERLKQTAVTQSALFVIELAMARLWMSWGVVPAAMIGHSIGEYVAACVSGVLRVEDALRLVALRGRLMGEMQPGTMLAVPLPESELQPMLGSDVWLAAVNAPSLCVVSGEKEAISAFADRLRQQGIEGRPLHTSHAFHSGMMDAAVEPLVEAAKGLELGAPHIPYVSNVTGTWITESQARDPQYWGRHMRGCVRFGDGVASMLRSAERVWLELGPGSALSSLTRQQLKDRSVASTLPTMRQAQEQTSDVAVAIGALGRLWLGGSPIDWTRFYADQRRYRIAVPTYPFERTYHWVEAERATRGAMLRLLSQTPLIDFSDWFHVPTWKRTRSAALPVAGAGDAETRTCLVFADEGGVGARMAATLTGLGYRAVIVEPGAEFAKVGADRYTVAPAERSDYTALMRDLNNQGAVPVAVAHLWMLTRLGERGAVAPRAYEDRGFYSLIGLAQAIGELGIASPIRIGVFTEGVHEVTGQETLLPEKATVIGPCRVIPQEFPNIACRQIDIELAAAIGEPQMAGMVSELFGASTEPIAAYRAGRRWVRTFDPVRFEPVAENAASRLRQGGVYLITGGMGGVGLVLADYLAREFKARLVLTGRRGLPPRAHWAEHIASRGPLDATSRRIQTVQALEAAGGEVLVGAADVIDESAMKAVVDEACARFGRIDGVIHAAGVAGGGMIQLKTPEIADAVLAPKVTGTQVLERVLAGRKLDFLMLCSSLTGVLGGVGQVDYCGANAYLDAFAAHYTATTGNFGIAVNWNAWREVGMAVDTEVPAALRDTLKGAMLASGITNGEGVDAFKRILAQATETQVALSPFDVHVAIEAEGFPAEGDEPALEAATGDGPARQGTGHARPNLPTPYVAPSTEVEKKLCALWQDAVGIEPVGVNDNFFDLGGHSLLAVQVMGAVNRALKTSVPVAKLYEGLTVAFLANVITQSSEPDRPETEDADLAERRREKSRRQKEHQQRRRVALGR
jgi:acyl transferase domain-containing protein